MTAWVSDEKAGVTPVLCFVAAHVGRRPRDAEGSGKGRSSIHRKERWGIGRPASKMRSAMPVRRMVRANADLSGIYGANATRHF